jgi:hypothetical protein
MVPFNQTTSAIEPQGDLPQQFVGRRHIPAAAADSSATGSLDVGRDDLIALAVAKTVAAARSQREKKFKRLVSEWKEQRNKWSSDPHEWAMSPAYQKIIAMGPEAIPLVLKELMRRPDHWFWALNMLSDTNPIRPEHAGDFREMINDWLKWGRENGYLWD